MTGDQSMNRRVSRLENDTASIYELITEIRTTKDEHSQRFDAMDTRFDAMDTRFDVMDTRFDAIETTLTEVVRRLPEPS
jgi:uncharacterized coiled-coil protein SlyX